MKIWIFTVCHNEEAMIPWFLRHYSTFADRILVWDDASTDNSRALLKANPLVTLFDWPYPSGLDEDRNLHHAYDVYPTARGKADWVMWVDCDEFIWSPTPMRDLLWTLPIATGRHADVATTAGFNMLSDGLPPRCYEHKQLWEHIPMGVKAPNYSKPVVFRPEAHVRWVRGKHQLENCSPAMTEKPLLKLLHYRYLGSEFTRQKNAKNYERVLDPDKGAAWTVAPTYDGADAEHEGSPAWADWARQFAFNVMESPL